MKHSFRLFQELQGLSAAAALAEACERWPEADGEAEAAAAQEDEGNYRDGKV